VAFVVRAVVSEPGAAIDKTVEGIPYTQLTIGVPMESTEGERRVAASPAVVAEYIKKGFKVKVEAGAGKCCIQHAHTLRDHREHRLTKFRSVVLNRYAWE
jgi:hypothetical protein